MRLFLGFLLVCAFVAAFLAVALRLARWLADRKLYYPITDKHGKVQFVADSWRQALGHARELERMTEGREQYSIRELRWEQVEKLL